MKGNVSYVQSLGLKDAVLLPIPHGEKGPRISGWQKKTLAEMQDPAYLSLFAEDGNIGVLLGEPSNGLCVIDIDSDEYVEPFLALNPALAGTLRTRGSRGCSLWLRINGEYPKAGKIKDVDGVPVMEWRAAGQQSVVHGVHPKGMPYQRIVEASPVAVAFDKIVWPDSVSLPWQNSKSSNFNFPAGVRSATSSHVPESTIDNARKYVAKMPPAISGQNGHDKTLAVACALIKGFNLTVLDALPLLREYNQICVPCWTDGELERKLVEADRLSDEKPRGHLILPEKPDYSSGISAPNATIILPGNGVTISKCAKVLFDLIAPSHTMFNRGGKVVEMVQDTGGRYRLQIVTPAAFRSCAEKFGRLFAWRTGKDNKPVLKPTTMPEETAKALLETKEARHILPTINTIINCPVLVCEGNECRIIGRGYDANGLFITGGEMPPPVAVNEAVKGLKAIIAEIDFISPGDRSRAIASMLTPALKLGRHVCGFVPADVAEADQSQAGKTYRQRVLAAIYNEVPGSVVKRDGGVGSFDESLAQKLLGGTPFIQIDNVRGKMDSQYLESLLTSDKAFSVRVPHHGEVEIKPDGFFIFLTSNGVETTPDFANRSNIIRIRKRVGHPYKAYPEGDLLSHVRSNQAYFLGCVFSIIREWVAQGKQKTSETAHDFREWVQVLDWIVQKVFNEPLLMAGHQETKERISNPAMTFLRKLAISIKDAAKLDVELCASAIYEHCEEQSLDIPGLTQTNLEAGRKRIGAIMGKIFQPGDNDIQVTLDSFLIERRISHKYNAERRENMPHKVYIFSSNEIKFRQPELPHNPTYPT